MPNSATLAKQRKTGERPYKVPPTDGRRLRYALPRIPVTAHELTVIRAHFEVAVAQAIEIFHVREESPNEHSQ
jgi:hypothetical protein